MMYTLKLTPQNLSMVDIPQRRKHFISKDILKEINNLIKRRGVAYLSFDAKDKNLMLHTSNVNKCDYDEKVWERYFNTENPMGFFLSYEFNSI